MSFIKTKPLIFWPSVIGIPLILAAVFVSNWEYIKKINPLEDADFLRQKMAPAMNETTGFLVISYAVILSIGNVIMKTSPKYLKGLTQGTSKTSGFVGWLQKSNMSWLPVLVSLGVTALASLLPINNKVLKIMVISGTLLGTLVASLFFNSIAKLFGAKESFTNVKEEFGHMVDGKPHNLTINVGSNENNDIYTSVDYGDKDGEGVDKHNMEAIYNEYTYEINEENLTNTILVKMSANPDNVKSRIFITDKPIGQTSGDHNAREVSQTAGEEISITVEGPTKKIYVHAITDSITNLYQAEIKKITDDTNKSPEQKTKAKKPFEDAEAALTAYKTAQTAVATAKAALEKAKKENKDIETKTTELETAKQAYSNAIYNALLKISGKSVSDYLAQTVSSAADGGKGLIITLKNMEQFFGFDAGKVKDTVRASYIAYYCLVWGSFLVYGVVTAFQQKKWIWGINKPWPFIIAALVETVLIGQSHYSLNESDVGGFKEASPTFSYAVAGFSTRIATVVAFLSSILTQVKD